MRRFLRVGFALLFSMLAARCAIARQFICGMTGVVDPESNHPACTSPPPRTDPDTNTIKAPRSVS